jgi:adenylosuccinate lyase
MAAPTPKSGASSVTAELSQLTAITPTDGRYRGRVNELAAYFSEFALIRYRVRIEVEYFIALCKLPVPPLRGVGSAELYAKLRSIYACEPTDGDEACVAFGLEAASEIKATERVTNHDVKAVEYYVKRRLSEFGLAAHTEWVHFALTSQDVNNTAIPLLLREVIVHSYLPALTTCVLQPLRAHSSRQGDRRVRGAHRDTAQVHAAFGWCFDWLG